MNALVTVSLPFHAAYNTRCEGEDLRVFHQPAGIECLPSLTISNRWCCLYLISPFVLLHNNNPSFSKTLLPSFCKSPPTQKWINCLVARMYDFSLSLLKSTGVLRPSRVYPFVYMCLCGWMRCPWTTTVWPILPNCGDKHHQDQLHIRHPPPVDLPL